MSLAHYRLTGFDAATGAPQWALPPTNYAIPPSIQPLGRVGYLADTDTLVLLQANVALNDWTSLGSRMEVYKGWVAGGGYNGQAPDVVVNITAANPKPAAFAGTHVFIGYCHTVPNIDAFSIHTGALDFTLINNSWAPVWSPRFLASVWCITSFRHASHRSWARVRGQRRHSVVTKDNYNVVHTVTQV